MTSFIEKLRRVKPSQIFDAWKLPIAAVVSLLYRRRRPNLWIVCEDAMEARDNGYWFYKYVRENHPEQDIVYAIKRHSVDFGKVTNLGETVEFGSLRHWVMYLASDKKISSQKAGNPNAAIFYFLEVYGLLKNTRIFLQHGITKDDQKWLYYSATKMTRFICGAFPEYDYVNVRFGYPVGNVVYTGFCRFDTLHDAMPNSQLILIMPTWREWIADEDNRLIELEGTTEIVETNYFKRWNEFIASPELCRIAQDYKVRFVFYPHRNMQKYMDCFSPSTPEIEVADSRDWDIQSLLKEAALMITDYSSVFFDFVYMKKPVVFYQFDYEQFRRFQYQEGYFDYGNNPFGKSYQNRKDVFDAIERCIGRNYTVSREYLEAHSQYFPLYDSQNCKRVYDVVEKA